MRQQPTRAARWALALLGLAALARVAVAQTTGQGSTVAEINAYAAAQAASAIAAIPEPGNALLWQNQPAGVQIVLPADDTILTHWKTADGAVSHLLGTVIDPPLNDGDYVSITRAGRYALFVTVTVTANPAVDFSVYVSADKKKVPGVKSTADGTIPTKHEVVIAAFADLALGKILRVGFSSGSGGALTINDVSLMVVYIGPEITIPPPP